MVGEGDALRLSIKERRMLNHIYKKGTTRKEEKRALVL